MRRLLTHPWLLMLFVISLIVYTAHVVVAHSILWGDSRYYYAFTRSIVMDHDIDFFNEAYRLDTGFPHQPEISLQTGRVINKYSPGAPLLWIPGFMVGEVVSWGLKTWGLQVVTDGFGVINQFGTGINAMIMAIAGMWLFWRLLRAHFKNTIATMSALFLLFTTQLLFYTMIDPLNSHSASFFLSALLCSWWVTQLDRERNSQEVSWKAALVGGLCWGWLTLVRNQDALIGVPVIVWLLSRCVSLRPRQLHFSKVGKALLFVLAAAGTMGIQVLTTLFLFGQFNSPYLIEGEGFAWLQPDFGRVLLSSGNGLWSFAPLTLIAFAACLGGLHFLLRSASPLPHDAAERTMWAWWVGGSLVVFFLELYLIAAWSPEIVGGPYGTRMFTSTLPWIGVGIALLGEQLSRTRSRFVTIGIWGVFGVLVANNIIQTLIMLKRF